MTVTEPTVSTALAFRTMAFFFAIRATPNAIETSLITKYQSPPQPTLQE